MVFSWKCSQVMEREVLILWLGIQWINICPSPTDESGEELEEEDFGPEGDGGRIDEDVVALGYSEL